MTSQSYAISIDINSEHITGALITAQGDISNLRSTTTPVGDGLDAILETVTILAKRQAEDAGDLPIIGIGVSTVGLVHHASGVILHADNSLPELQDISIQESIEKATGLPVHVENNVNAMALAEAHHGAGQSRSSFFYIFADVYLNGAFVQNGKIWHGTHYSAGQIGNLVVGWMGQRPIELSQRASGTGIAAEYNMRSRKFRIPSLVDIIQYAEHGDQLASRVIRDGAQVLATVLSPVINFIDPECVVVGGTLVGIEDLWWKTFQETLRSSPLPALSQVEIAAAEIAESPALIGASILAHHRAK